MMERGDFTQRGFFSHRMSYLTQREQRYRGLFTQKSFSRRGAEEFGVVERIFELWEFLRVNESVLLSYREILSYGSS